MKLRRGALCLFENPTGEGGRALIRLFVRVRKADRMGFDDIWRAECADDPAHPSTAVEALLGHLAGVMSKARIGTVAQPWRREAQPFAQWRAGAEGAAAMLARSLVGIHAEVAQALRRLGERFGLRGVIVVPMGAGFDDAKYILADLVDEVRPLLDD